MADRIRKFLEKLFATVVVVGDKSRALGPGEVDEDARHLIRMNDIWRKMLWDDPWSVKLRRHTRLLLAISAFLFIVLFESGIYLPQNETISSLVLVLYLFSLPYWLWVARWRRRIEGKVFAEFRRRYGEQYHLY